MQALQTQHNVCYQQQFARRPKDRTENAKCQLGVVPGRLSAADDQRFRLSPPIRCEYDL